jgi:hypothetical protein
MGVLQIVSDAMLITNNVQKQLQSEKFCDCMKFRTCEGLAIVRVQMLVLQKLKSLRGIMVRNIGLSETSFFVVCDDIRIAK